MKWWIRMLWILWIQDLYFIQKQWFEDKSILMMDLFFTNRQLFTSQDINWWTGVLWITCGLLFCYYQLFGLLFWRHPFTAEDALVSKWHNATFLQICSDEETISSTSLMAWGWQHFQNFFIVWVNYSKNYLISILLYNYAFFFASIVWH